MGVSYDKAGPSAQFRILSHHRTAHDSISSFSNAGSRANTLRQAQDSLRCFAAGAHRWVSFRDLVGGRYCSPTSALILRWRAILKPGRTLGGYIDRLAKASHLLNIALHGIIPLLGSYTWLGGAQDVSFKFENYTSNRLFRGRLWVVKH